MRPSAREMTYWVKQRARVLLIAGSLLAIAWYTLAGESPALTTFSPRANSLKHQDWKPSQHGVLVSSVPGWHADVWIGVAAVLERMGVETELYTECKGFNFAYGKGDTCIRYKLPRVAYEKGIWTKPLKHKDEFLDAVNTPMANGRLADTVLLPTAWDDVPAFSNDLLKLWHARPDDQKFKLVVIVHQVRGGWLAKEINDWADIGAIRLLTISEHVRDYLLEDLRQRAMTYAQAPYGLENVPVGIIVPYMPVGDPAAQLAELDRSFQTNRNALSSAVVVGTVEKMRRDTGLLIEQTEKAVEADPALWGYKLSNGIYVPLEDDETSSCKPFKLTVLGVNHDKVKVDPKYENVIDVTGPLEQDAMDAKLLEQDVMLLAWNPDFFYIKRQASGSFDQALESGIPPLVTQTILDKYTHIHPDVTITRPHGISELEALRLFRLLGTEDGKPCGRSSAATKLDLPTRIWDQVEIMLAKGWKRDAGVFMRNLEALDKLNERALKEVLMS